MRGFFVPARFMELALYFTSAFTQDPQRLKAWKTLFEKDLKKIQLDALPLSGTWGGDYRIDERIDEHQVALQLRKVGWHRVSTNALVFEKEVPKWGVFRIQIRRWRAQRGRYKTFIEQYADSTRKRDEEREGGEFKANENAKKKYGYDKEMQKNRDVDKPMPAHQTPYNYIKYTHEDEILAILELTQRDEQKPYNKEHENDLKKAGLDKETVSRPTRDPNFVVPGDRP